MNEKTLVRALAAVWFVATVITTSSSFAADPKCEPAKLAVKYPSLAGKTLKLAISGDIKPISYRDPDNLDHLLGFSPDQARAVFDCIGAPYELVVSSFSGSLAALTAGQVDALWGTLFYTPERAKVVDLVIFMIGASGGVVPKENPKNIHALGDLCGLRAVAPIGGIEAAKLNETNQSCLDAHKPGLEVLTSTDRPSAFRLLDNDRVDLYLGIGFKQSYDPDRYTFAFAYANDLKTGVGVQKGNKDLAQAIFDAFSVMHANDTDKALFVKYGIDPALMLPPQIITQ
jgi:polar amino acid transport system substrate-binding protein